MKILAIETSCDETAAAIVEDTNDSSGVRVCASMVASQDEIHAPYGGIIPELACRRHVEILPKMVAETLSRAQCNTSDLDGIAVTRCPGLMGALLVGVSYAKALAFATKLPLVGVNHLAGHLAAIRLQGDEIPWPHLGLLVSGGHSLLYLGQQPGNYRLLGNTRDDAAGEAFDKVAKLMGLGYPGGRKMEQLAATYLPDVASASRKSSVVLPKVQLKDGKYGFSFSGLKTAVAQFVQKNPKYLTDPYAGELAYVFQERVLDILGDQLRRALSEFRPRGVIFCGGVAANQRLRQGLKRHSDDQGISFFVPELKWCTDNAAMIGAMGLWQFSGGIQDPLDMIAQPQYAHTVEEMARDFFPRPLE